MNTVEGSSTRRRFLSAASIASVAGVAQDATTAAVASDTRIVSLNGSWQFRLDDDSAWRAVEVPHTWQTEPATAEYMGAAWYKRTFDVPVQWRGGVVRVEFEAVFHSAVVTVNGREAGSHARKGYTAFTLDISHLLRYGAANEILVRVDNSFDDAMLPRGRSSDWTHDGGIYRPVQLLVTPPVYIERLDVDAEPAADGKTAAVEVTVVARNAGTNPWSGTIGFEAREKSSGSLAIEKAAAATVTLAAGETREVKLPAATLTNPSLWHFDHPHLYELRAALGSHSFRATFGVRRIETRNGAFFLNGERVRLIGVERMAGSNPEFGMAEPSEWIEHDHADMKELNCVYTRVHWQQDRRVLDYCDRHGIFIQVEVPTWGPRTFAGMGEQPSDVILQNGLEQLREMIARERNHPCVFSWGVCNEIGGQNPPAYNFARRMYAEAKKLDPRRLATYASNSLQSTPEKDVSGLMDYVMWNEYYESWFKGTAADMSRNLGEIHRAFPDKAVVISEYGYCACTENRPEGDVERTRVLTGHNRIFRENDFVAGLIFFCYNDYRTHVGDKGRGVMKQRVHGVVDLYGNRKPSFEVLRRESSPIESLEIAGAPDKFQVTVKTRASVPSYMLTGYKLRAVAFGYGDIPLEGFESELPRLAPGREASIAVALGEKAPRRVQFDVLRPTGFSAYTRVWRSGGKVGDDQA